MNVLTRLLAAAFILLALAPLRAPAELDPVERRLAAAIEREHAQALALLRRVVNINSGTMNFAGVRAVGDAFRAELDALGFATEWIDGAPFGRAGHLVARRHRGGRLRLLLIGHLDTVFEPDSPFQRFERVSATEARGPGIIDMKGGDVIIVSTLKALRAEGVLEGVDISVIMTGDEEDMGEAPLSRAALVDAARRTDIALAFEDGAGDPARAVVARRGHTEWTLRVTARASHSSQIFQDDVGAGAIFEASRVLSSMRERFAREPMLTLSAGLLLGGTSLELDAAHAHGTASGKSNVVPGDAVAVGDLRAASAEELADAKRTIEAIAATPLPHTSSRVTFSDGYPPMASTPGNERLLALYDRVSRDLGTGPVAPTHPRDAGAADVSFAAVHVEMALDGIGLMGRGGHTVGETADVRTLLTQTQRAAVLIHRLIATR